MVTGFVKITPGKEHEVELPEKINSGSFSNSYCSGLVVARRFLTVTFVAVAILAYLTLLSSMHSKTDMSLGEIFQEKFIAHFEKIGDFFATHFSDPLFSSIFSVLSLGALVVIGVAINQDRVRILRSTSPKVLVEDREIEYRPGKLWGHDHFVPVEYRKEEVCSNVNCTGRVHDFKFLAYLDTSAAVINNGFAFAPIYEPHPCKQDVVSVVMFIVGAPLFAIGTAVYNAIKTPFAFLYVFFGLVYEAVTEQPLDGKKRLSMSQIVSAPCDCIWRIVEAPFYGVALCFIYLYCLLVDSMNGRKLGGLVLDQWNRDGEKTASVNRGLFWIIPKKDFSFSKHFRTNFLGKIPVTPTWCRSVMAVAKFKLVETGESDDGLLNGMKLIDVQSNAATTHFAMAWQKPDGSACTFENSQNLKKYPFTFFSLDGGIKSYEKGLTEERESPYKFLSGTPITFYRPNAEVVIDKSCNFTSCTCCLGY